MEPFLLGDTTVIQRSYSDMKWGILKELHQRAGVLKAYWDKPLFYMNWGTGLALPTWYSK